MGDFNIPKVKEFEQVTKDKFDKTKAMAINNVKSNFINYFLMVCILFILGAFDIFVIKRNDKMFDTEYWYHAISRLGAYGLASILGLRIGYPKAIENNLTLSELLTKNKTLKQEREEDFGDFLDEINVEVKIVHWKSKINNEIRRLEKRAKIGYHEYYKTQNKEVLKSYQCKKITERKVRKADKYCQLRKELETKQTDEYIKENLNYLNIKSPIIYQADFDCESIHHAGIVEYKTKKTTKQTETKIVSSTLLWSIFFLFLLSCIILDIDEALAEQRAVAIVSMIFNVMIDVCFTLWKFVSAYSASDKVVEQEDLRVAVDQNTLLRKYKTWRKPKTEVVE